MSKVRVKIWGRFFNLYVDFDGNDESKFTEKQKELLSEFLKLEDTILEDTKQILNFVKNDCSEIVSDNVFKYVVPHYLYVPDNTQNEVILMCNYKYDQEHGLAIVYKNKRIHKITYQDNIL